MSNVVIVSAARTPIGSFNGSLSSLSGHEIGSVVIKEVIQRAGISADDVNDVILGQVLTGGVGQNAARQASILAGLPHSTPALQINQVCGSGLRAVAMGFQAIKSGDAKILIAGGQESMSQSGHVMNIRTPVKFGDAKLIDSMIKDGLWDAFNNYHMGNTAENVARKFDISRDEQDEFAAHSQQKAEQAQNSGRFNDEIVSVKIQSRKEEVIFDKDEYIRPGTTSEKLAKLRPAFDTVNGTVTAGNASGINDGAAALLLMTEEEALSRDLEILAKIKSWASCGVDPAIMGTGPIPSSQNALDKAGWSVEELDLIEANEAFAAQAISVNKAMKWDVEKVNVNGGAIALGHPIGASGARILVTLIHEMKKRDSKKGLATLCVGGGMGVAMCIER